MKKIFPLFIAGILVLFTSCEKGNEQGFTAPEDLAHFANQSSGTYQVLSSGTTFKIPIGTTTISSSDRTVSFSVSSPTGAIQGTHYTLNKSTATIKAGLATDTIVVTGVPALYTAGRKDTLVFTIREPSIKSAGFNDTFKLAMRGPCFEGDVNLTQMLGAYTRTNETFGTSSYGPYNTTISSAVSTGATTARITVTNIWDSGWGPIQFDLDWTDAANRKVTVVAQPAIPGSNAGDINSAYAGQTIQVRPFTGQTGTFSACNGTLTLKMQLGVTGVGFFGSLYTVNMIR